MKSIPVSEIPGAIDAGINCGMICGVANRKRAKKLAEHFVRDLSERSKILSDSIVDLKKSEQQL